MADFIKIAERPNTAANVWTKSPKPIPNAVKTPFFLPLFNVCVMVIITAGPGIKNNRSTIAINDNMFDHPILIK
ncbi:hypothetical protein D3C79_1011690 [compost metagenome]